MKNITHDGYGYRVLVERNGVKFDGFIKFGDDRAAALRRAVALRDEVRAKLEPKRARSNTGVAGVTELAHWTRGQAQACFVVTHGKPGPNWKHRFFFKTFSQRQQQLAAAVRCRAKLAGEPLAQLMEAADV